MRITNKVSSTEVNYVQLQGHKLEKYLSRKSILIKKKDECIKNIRELGVLPHQAFDAHETTDSKTLMQQLHIVNEGLKKFSHVNKKAFEQYTNFTKQRENLNKRKDDLDTSAQVILKHMFLFNFDE